MFGVDLSEHIALAWPILLAAGCPRADGAPCAADDERASGECDTEADEGWAGGFCRAQCDSHDACSPGTFCGQLQPEDDHGVCVAGCAPGSCRAGYDCFLFGGPGSAMGACLPACRAADECAAGSTCNEWSGLCLPDGGGGRNGTACRSDGDCESGECLADSDGWTARDSEVRARLRAPSTEPVPERAVRDRRG